MLLINLTGQLPLEGFRDTLFRALEHFFPMSQEWIVRNLGLYVQEAGLFQATSLVLLAWVGSALFFTLKAALESAYRVEFPRNFVGSQVRSTVLILALGVLALLATAVLHWTVWLAVRVLPAGFPEPVIFLFSHDAFAFVVVLCLMCAAFYFLPNHDVPFRRIPPEAIFATVLVLGADWVFRWLAPEMRCRQSMARSMCR